MTPDGEPLRPADVCRGLGQAMDASEGRRKRRQRDTTPDVIGFDLKRALLGRVVEADPEPDAFEEWLLTWCAEHGRAQGPAQAVAREVLVEWRLALASPAFRVWLASGAPSDDAPLA